MYIYRALINALSTHTIAHINLNMILYTHVELEHSPIENNLHKKYYMETHTDTPQ